MSLQRPSVSEKWVKVLLVDFLKSSSYSHIPHTPVLHPPTLHTPSPVTSFHFWATSMLSGLVQHYRKLDVTIYITMCPPLPSPVLTDYVLSEEDLVFLNMQLGIWTLYKVLFVSSLPPVTFSIWA